MNTYIRGVIKTFSIAEAKANKFLKINKIGCLLADEIKDHLWRAFKGLT